MKVFLPVDTEQNLIITPRNESDNVIVTIRSKQTEEVTLINATSTFTNGYMVIPITYSFTESYNYELKVTDDSLNLLWRGEGYSTVQTDLQNYKMNTFIATFLTVFESGVFENGVFQ